MQHAGSAYATVASRGQQLLEQSLFNELRAVVKQWLANIQVAHR